MKLYGIYSKIACSRDSEKNNELLYERPDGTVVQVHCVVEGENESAAHEYIKRKKETGTTLTDLCVIGEVTKCVKPHNYPLLPKDKVSLPYFENIEFIDKLPNQP